MPLPAMIAPRNAVAALRWPTVSAAAPNATAVATAIVADQQHEQRRAAEVQREHEPDEQRGRRGSTAAMPCEIASCSATRGDDAAGEADRRRRDAPRSRASRTSPSAAISCSPRSASVVRNAMRTSIIATLPSALTWLERASRASASRRFARRSSSSPLRARVGAAAVRRRGRRTAGSRGSFAAFDRSRERVARRAARSGERHEHEPVRREERADAPRRRPRRASTRSGGSARMPVATSPRPPRRAPPASAPCTTTSTVSVALTRASSRRRSCTAGASCGSRYEKSAYSGSWNAIRYAATPSTAAYTASTTRPRRRNHAT